MHFSPEITTLILALLPGIEIRGALAYSKLVGLDFFWGAFIPLVVSMLILPIVYGVVHLFLDMLLRFDIFRRYVLSARRKVSNYVNKYGFVGLILFVAVPLPGTGLYTGSFGAALLGLDWKRSVIALYIGNLIAFFIVGSLVGYW